MADLNALRDHIRQLMINARSGSGLTIGTLYAEMESAARSSVDPESDPIASPPVGRTTFYNWLRPDSVSPSPLILECIPALANVFGVSEYELYHSAGLLPREIDTSLSLIAAAAGFSDAISRAASALEAAGLSSAGEALVLDRIMRNGLDYRITVLPIVRGVKVPIHVHSWIVLDRVDESISQRRRTQQAIDKQEISDRRELIRHSVISDGLWRSLGLRWREHPGPEWPRPDFPELCIEVPVEERNKRPSQPSGNRPRLAPSRIIVLSAPFAHGELLVSLLAGALGLGTIDIRYQGLEGGELPRPAAVVQFCRDQLNDTPQNYAWCIAQERNVLAELREPIMRNQERYIHILLTYGTETRRLGAEVWGISEAELADSAEQAARIAAEINENYPVISVDYSDQDYLGADKRVDFNLLTDHVRITAAAVLNLLFDHCSGPSVDQWGDRFADFRESSNMRARVPDRASRVRWLEPRTLAKD